MSEAIACLVRVGDNVKKNRLIKLDREQVTIGRSGDVTYAILSNMISRCHAILKRPEGDKWTITDNKSLNGVYVNGRQLTPFIACTMEDGDMVQFGVPISPGVPAEFLYKFHTSLKVRVKKETNKRLREDLTSSNDTKFENAGSQNDSDGEGDRKRKVPMAGCSGRTETTDSGLDDNVSNHSKEAEYLAKLAQMEKLLQEKEMKQSEVEKQLEKEKQDREQRMKEVEELRIKDQAILVEMQDKQTRLEKEKEELKEQMKAELEANLKEREQALISQLADQKQSLIEEKKRVEESLQAEMAKALEVKSKEVEERLISMKENLDKVIEKKDNEQKLLETQLHQTKEENECAKLQAMKAREDVLSNFVDLMEMELQCTICNELFIKATALNCAHVFCKLCINQWMRVKKECPNCRMKITSHMQAIALDSYIEKMVEQLTDDQQEKRKSLLEQRKAEQDKFDGMLAGPSRTVPVPTLPLAAATTARGRGRSRGGNRGGRGRNARGRGRNTRAQFTAAAATTVAVVNPIIIPAAAPSITVTPTVLAYTTVTTTATGAATTSAAGSTLSGVSTSTTATTGVTTPIILSDGDGSELTDSDDMNEEDMEEILFHRRMRMRRRRGISTTDEDEDEERDDDDEDNISVEGVPSEYYGGYGRCFKCGSRGHWANGCPF